jgi:hypothetical protein
MNAVVVDADRLGNIAETLATLGVMRHFRDLARARAVPVVCCRRSTICVAESVQRCLAQRGNCPAHRAAQNYRRG